MSSFISWTFGAFAAGLLSVFAVNSLPTTASFALSLSNGSDIYVPGTESFVNASKRWSAAARPTFDAIVRVATEEDVSKTILYANARNKPFLAISGGHGTTSTLSNVKHGIGILLHQLNNITILQNGKAALMGGGVQTGDIVPYLWSHGKQTMTTGCDCTGYLAPILGGGHGWLQGRYGKATDQLMSARLVLANGTAIFVSKDENADMFWAIRGAGHNFGIVTQATIRVYDRQPEQDQWAATSFVYSHDRLEDVASILNHWIDQKDRPEELTHYGIFAHNPDVDLRNPVIILWVYYQGSSIPAKYTDPLYALSPVATESSVTDLAGVNAHIQATRDGASCAKGLSRVLLPVSLKRYDISALRKVIEIFAHLPNEYRNSVMFLEGYAVNRVREIESDDSAYPDREGMLLLSPLFNYAANESLDAGAWKIGTEIRDVLLEASGEPLRAYVNYARGDESVEDVYGVEPWRLEKLRRLKKEFDPRGRFNFYAPIS